MSTPLKEPKNLRAHPRKMSGVSGLPSGISPFSAVTASIAGGAMFGFCMRQSGVFIPPLIRAQMKFTDFNMMFAFLGAATSSIVSFSILSFVNPRAVQRVALANLVPTRGLLATIVGSFLLGSGMTVSGSCPGTVYTQAGMLTQNFAFVLLGGVIGAYLYGKFAFPASEKIGFNTSGSFSMSANNSFAGLVGRKDNRTYASFDWKVSMAFAGMLSAFLVFLSYVAPRQVLPPNYWHPLLGGIGMGASNLILPVFVGKTLGSSSSYSSVVASLVDRDDEKSYFADYKRGIGSYTQLIFLVAAAGGSFLANIVFPGPQVSVPASFSTPSMVESFLGGLLLVLGSRMADNCTSGSGISALGSGSTTGLIAVAAMFAGGMATALLY